MSDRTDELWREIYEAGLDLGMDEDSAAEQADDAYEAACDGGYPGER